MKLFIAPDAEPIRNVSPHKRFDPSHMERKRVITDVELAKSGTSRTPDPAIYRYDSWSGIWTLKDNV